MRIELSSEDQAQLTALAQTTQRSETEIVRETVHWYLEWQRTSLEQAVREGDQDFEQGHISAHEEVVAQFADVLRRQ